MYRLNPDFRAVYALSWQVSQVQPSEVQDIDQQWPGIFRNSGKICKKDCNPHCRGRESFFRDRSDTTASFQWDQDELQKTIHTIRSIIFLQYFSLPCKYLSHHPGLYNDAGIVCTVLSFRLIWYNTMPLSCRNKIRQFLMPKILNMNYLTRISRRIASPY